MIEYKTEKSELVRFDKRISFVYFERCDISRQDGAVVARDEKGYVTVPASSTSAIMLGPGTNITHRAIELLGESGASIIWCGENGIRFYADGSSLNSSSAFAIRQAELASNSRKRLAVARMMYQIRFPDTDMSDKTMRQMRGLEGQRVKKKYTEQASAHGMKWSKRNYDFDSSDLVNKAITSGYQCMYGIAHCAIRALGLSPALGFIHTGKELSFVYDIADLYKVDIVVPLAFDIVAKYTDNNLASTISSIMRTMVRDKIREEKILNKITNDIISLMSINDNGDKDINTNDSELRLFDDNGGTVKANKMYSMDDENI